MKQPVIKLTHGDVREICDAIRDGFSSIALALSSHLFPAARDADDDPAMPSKNRLAFNTKKAEK